MVSLRVYPKTRAGTARSCDGCRWADCYSLLESYRVLSGLDIVFWLNAYLVKPYFFLELLFDNHLETLCMLVVSSGLVVLP